MIHKNRLNRRFFKHKAISKRLKLARALFGGSSLTFEGMYGKTGLMISDHWNKTNTKKYRGKGAAIRGGNWKEPGGTNWSAADRRKVEDLNQQANEFMLEAI